MKVNSDIKKISVSDLPDLRDFSTLHIFKANQVIFYEGHFPYGLFILLEGTVEFVNPQVTEKIETGETVAILGINSFINSLFYSGTAKALTTCTVNFLSKTSFDDLKNKNNQLVSMIQE